MPPLRFLIILPLLWILGCSKPPPPPQDAESIEKEIERVQGEIQRERQNK